MSSSWGRRRDDLKAHWNRERAPRARKDRKRWCMGKVGVEHKLVLAIPANAYRRSCRAHGYYIDRGPEVRQIWQCGHVQMCEVCGKVTKHTVPCPDNTAGIKQSWL